jgi:Ca2+-binding EF-hand superfamily protein
MQKMAPNLTEEQTLIKYFKYFDLDNSGQCTIKDFIKAVEKIGVIFPKTNDMQKVFKNYDNDSKGIVDYKVFASYLFSPRVNNNIQGSDQSKSKQIEYLFYK